jgi:hypothetical protein
MNLDINSHLCQLAIQLNNADFLHPLLNGGNLTIQFIVESNIFVLKLQDGVWISGEEAGTNSKSITITGPYKTIVALITGDLRLQLAMKRGEVQVDSSMRHLLRTETFLCLGNSVTRQLSVQK